MNIKIEGQKTGFQHFIHNQSESDAAEFFSICVLALLATARI